jgi:trafficking protein particle complex subunit 11
VFRILPDGSHGEQSKTSAPLPILQPPTDDLVALVDIAPTATLHTPIPMTIVVRNNHPQRSADIAVQLESDMTDGFVVVGLRAGRVPVLLPGVEERLTWSLIPLECGYVRIPRIRVFDRRKVKQNAIPGDIPNPDTSVGEPVKVVDLRRDRRHRVSIQGEEGEDTIDHDPGTEFGTVLVLPPRK